MESMSKFFPLMPDKGDGGKLALAIIFYIFVPPLVCSIIGAILGATLILLPLAFPVGMLGTVYTVMGIVYAISHYNGKKS